MCRKGCLRLKEEGQTPMLLPGQQEGHCHQGGGVSGIVFTHRAFYTAARLLYI